MSDHPNAKPWYQSATIYMLALSITAKALIMAGVGTDDAQKLAGELTTLWLPAAGIGFDLLAAWARKVAKGPLTVIKKPATEESK